MVWSCKTGHRESFGLARVRINEVWISKGRVSEGLLYCYSSELGMSISGLSPGLELSKTFHTIISREKQLTDGQTVRQATRQTQAGRERFCSFEQRKRKKERKDKERKVYSLVNCTCLVN